MKVSRRSQVPSFVVMDVVARAAAMAADGRDVITLCVGEPGGGAPAPVRERAAHALHGTLGYTSGAGLPELRAELSGHYRRWYDREVDPERFLLTTGASGAFLIGFLAAFDAGDRVAITRPGYPAYRNILTSLGYEAVEIPAGAAQGFRLTLDALEAEHARRPLAGVLIASPANPTGTVTGPDDLADLVRWCRGNGIRFVSDEIYHGLTYGDARTTTAADDQTAITIGSFSKYWGMTGWRLGWLIVPDDLAAAASAVAGNVQLCAPVPAQHAALAAFTPASYAECDARVAGLARARAEVLGRAASLGWTRCAPVDGAFYVWADVSASGLDSSDYCAQVLSETGVALAPGIDFDRVDGRDWVRLSFSPGLEAVREGCDRIERWTAARSA